MSRRQVVLASILFAAVVMGLSIWAVGPLTASRRASNERGPGASLKTIASAQADFRGNDRDGNRIQDYWRRDVAGLHALVPEGSAESVGLIEAALAASDAAPGNHLGMPKTPKDGYWVRALRHADEAPDRLDPKRFAATAYPADGTGHRWAYILSEANTLYRRRWNGPSDTPSVYPADPLKDGWSPHP